LATLSACRLSLASCLSSYIESLPSVPDTYEYPIAVVVSDVPGGGSHVHKHDHGRSEAPDGSPDSILSSEPKPLRKHRPPPPPSILCLAVELSPTSYLELRVDKYNLLWGGCLDSGISSLRSTGSAMYRDGCSGGDGNASVTALIRD
ncbi:hypothetical protein Tco_0061234, partial [Tanacetum coccineum]